MPSLRAGLVFALMLGALLPQAQAQWKWRDASGKIQYSDRPPPPGVADKDILQQPPGTARAPVLVMTTAQAAAAAAAAAADAASKAAPKPENKVDNELEAKRRKAEQEQAAKAKAEELKNANTRRENCAQARSYLRTLEDGQRVSRTNEKGEREIMDDKLRADEAARARSVINSDCAK